MNSDNNNFWASSQFDRAFDFKAVFTFWILVLSFLSILIKLYYLQIIQGPNYIEQAQENTTFILSQTAPRGIIYDRDKKVLASNKQSSSLIILPSIVLNRNFYKISDLLGVILKKEPYKIRQQLQKLNKNDSRPFTLQTNLTLEQVSAIYENQLELPGVTVQQNSARFYAHGQLLSHVLGYTGKISPEELKRNPERRMNDIVGKFGLEKIFDNVLRGIDASKRIRVNRLGQPVERVDLDEVASAKTQSGTDITLTIDLDLQRAAEKAIDAKGFNGAVVLIDARSGEIYSLVSKPSFDPNLFTSSVSGELWKNINSKKTFLNRALSAYPPGSIWKPVVLLAALESKAVKAGDKFNVSGAYYLGRVRFGDWTSKTGVMGLQTSLAWSRDTAFYQMARKMTDKDITKWGKVFGAGKASGIEFNSESHGSVPDKEYKAKYLKSQWYPGNTLHYSIGQGFLLMTPAQAVRMAAGIGNGEFIPDLHLIRQMGNQLPKTGRHDSIKASPENLQIVKEGMKECVDSGTCQIVKMPGISIAGKTGSAEAPPNRKTHGWFIGYSPAENPEIAIVVFAEAAGHGGAVAAPVAKEVILAYYEKYHGYNLKAEQEKLWRKVKGLEAPVETMQNVPSLPVSPPKEIVVQEAKPTNKPILKPNAGVQETD